jgi:hypothetical protein
MSSPYRLPTAPIFGLGNDGIPVMVPPTQLGEGGTPPLVSDITQQIFLPELYPIPDAKEFNQTGSQATAAVAFNQVIAGTTITVPQNTFGVVRGVTFYITNMLTSTNVTYSLIINNQPVMGYNQEIIFPRAAPFVSNGYDSMIRFQGPATLTINFDNRDGGTYVVGGTISGWFWPQASDARWRRFGS